MDFGEVLGTAWRIIWKHKILWIFGIFAGCGRGAGGSSGGSGTGWQESSGSGGPFPSDVTAQLERIFEQVGEWISENLWVVALAILLVLILSLLAMFLGTIGKIGLIRGTFKADAGAEKLSFGETFRESLPFFWRVFLLGLIVGLLAFLIFVPLVLFGLVTVGIGFLLALPLICILVPLFWALGLLVQQASLAMVIENLSLTEGVRRGWEVLRKHIGPVLLIWLITAVIGAAIGLVLAIPIFITVVPAALAFAASGGEFPTGIVAVAGLCFVLYIPVFIVAQGILTAYIESVWAVTYLRLTRPSDNKVAPQPVPANA